MDNRVNGSMDYSQGDGVTTNLDMQPQNGAAQDTLLSQGREQSLMNEGVPELTDKSIPGEEYSDFVLPEQIDAKDAEVQGALSEAKALFREMGLNQSQAQKLIDLHMKHYIGGIAEDNELFEQELNKRVAQWGEQVKANPEFGGANLKNSIANINKAIAQLGGPELYNALTNETGVINHPAIFAAFAKIGRMLGEDKFVSGLRNSVRDNSPAGVAARIYPSMVRK